MPAITPRDPAARMRQLIGIARRQLGIPDDSHQARVHRVTDGRTRSTTECTSAELEQVLAEYRASGFRPTGGRRAGRRPPAEKLTRGSMLTRVEQLLTVQRLPWGYAEAILARQRGLPTGVPCPLTLANDQELRGVIAALDRRRRRLSSVPEASA
jgi:hypothetical protein